MTGVGSLRPMDAGALRPRGSRCLGRLLVAAVPLLFIAGEVPGGRDNAGGRSAPRGCSRGVVVKRLDDGPGGDQSCRPRTAGSAALLAFGATAPSRFWRRRCCSGAWGWSRVAVAERRAAGVTGVLLLVSAVWVVAEAGFDLWRQARPDAGAAGRAIAAASTVVMPWIVRHVAVRLDRAAFEGGRRLRRGLRLRGRHPAGRARPARGLGHRLAHGAGGAGGRCGWVRASRRLRLLRVIKGGQTH